jgi:hypothetical protein
MTLLQAIMSKDGCSRQDAEDLIDEMRERIYLEGEDPEEVLFDEGLEPDYVDDLLDGESNFEYSDYEY